MSRKERDIRRWRKLWRIGLAALLALCAHASTRAAHAEDPPDLRIKEEEKITPNPALIGETAQAKYTAHLYKKGTNEEIFPAGTSVIWSCAWTKKDGGTQVNNPPNVSFSPSSTGHNEQTTMSASFGAVGNYEIRINVRASNSAWTPTYVESRTSANLTVKDVIVTFSPSSLRTGYWNDGKKDIVKDVTATVRPAGATSNVSIAVKSGADTDGMTLDNNVSISDVTKNTTAGTIAFKVRGTGASTAKKPNGSYKTEGNTLIEGQVGGVGKGSMRVCVVVPSTIAKPQNVSQYVVGENIAMDKTTRPADYQVTPPAKSLVTSYDIDIAVGVLDQFGDSLDALYNDAEVWEQFVDTNRGLVNINQKIQSGSYTDPVGFMRSGPTEHYYVFDSTTLEGQKEVQDWVNGVFGKSAIEKKVQSASDAESNKLTAIVAGHSLSPAIVRSVGFIPKDDADFGTEGTLTITWITPSP